jgi:hypothetical protein
MKTTLSISDELLREAKEIAAREGTTLSGLVEDALRRAVADRKQEGEFRLRKASFEGRGLHPELRDAGWDQIRALAYER